MNGPGEDAAGESRAFPWADAIRVGLRDLGLAPDTFWRMTPREFAIACAAPKTPTPDRAALDALMHRFPDRAKDTG